MLQATVWALTGIGIGFVLLVYLYVFVQSGKQADTATVTAGFYRIRPWWFGVLAVVMVVAAAFTLPQLPYADTHNRAATPPDLTVQVVGHQWYWELSQNEVPVNKDIAFEVTAKDVNHSFAIYDESGRMVAQTQAMPGYTNILRYRFDTPGTYKLLCLEYCGVVHHAMRSDFVVTAENGEAQQ